VNSGLQRSRRLLLGAGSTAVSKGVLFAVNLLYVPIVIRHLGAVSFGVWTTITTTLTMLLVLDLGVANSLTNFISEAYARGDHEHASRYTTTAFGLMACISCALGLVAYLMWPYLDWGRLFNVVSPPAVADVAGAVAVALAIFLLDLPARLAAKVLGGYQEFGAANLFVIIGSLASLMVTWLLARAGAGMPALVAGSSGPIVALDVLCTLWLLWVRKPWLRPRVAHLDRGAARRLLSLGGGIFLLQISGLLVFDSDNLIIAHYLGPAEVASYSAAWRLASGATAVYSLTFPALWPAFCDAFVRSDIAWARKTFWRVLWISMLAALVFASVLAVCGRWVIRVWATSAAVPGETLMLLMCIWVIVSTFMNNTVTVLLASGEIRLLSWLALAVGLLNVGLSISLVKHIGTVGVILGTILSYVIVVLVPQSVLAWRALYGNVPRAVAAP
jgi:O-antigen/teichoic acid export membrane protein